ncbi:YIF1-domain-containing protein [Suhomyces tanzawaensis NRRL Y-17324]|uniref:Protein YIF1 n=1 Tax=Suhomyces tanzawaensis NRRL Y-17324 TaxID=984487 RepID=A0A1E4SKV2_9ASCO|nr:YIF1-domain-containing protein [Suhomyces tanzawaensis NRRL Y-17324]ODV80120.1 YIF1-domain-containing protein [Suhomyces tanzawaensis NRRL Y-17324]
MYNPYGNSGGYQQGHPQQQAPGQQFDGQANLHHPQPQHPAFQAQYGQPGGVPGATGGQQASGYPSFLNDQAASIASQFAKSQFETSNQYLQQNFGSFFPGTGDIKYYFQVSNSYVLRKVLLIVFPYHNKNWNRLTASEVTGEATSGQNQFAPPNFDVNAPDLYIPLVSFVTYILLWASFQGLNGDFHPQVFGYLASQTLAFSFLDIAIFKIGLYLLNCSTQSSLWDLVSFSGYKYVSIIILLCWKHVIGNGWMTYYPVIFFLIINLSVFLMRSLKFMVLPNNVTGTSNSITTSQRRIRIQFLFVYSLIIQGLIILYMSR